MYYICQLTALLQITYKFYLGKTHYTCNFNNTFVGVNRCLISTSLEIFFFFFFPIPITYPERDQLVNFITLLLCSLFVFIMKKSLALSRDCITCFCFLICQVYSCPTYYHLLTSIGRPISCCSVT